MESVQSQLTVTTPKEQPITSYPSTRGALLKSGRTSAPDGWCRPLHGGPDDPAAKMQTPRLRHKPKWEGPRLTSTCAQRLRNGARPRPGEETDESVRFLRETSADLPCEHDQLGTSTVLHQLWKGSLLAASSCHQSCAINLCTPSVRFSICAERRDECGIDGPLRTVKNRKSLGDHLNASLILDADANQIQIPQEHIRRNSCSRFATHASCCRLQCVTPSPQHTCQRTTCTVMVKAVERTAARVGRRAPQKEHTKEVGIEPLRTAVKGGAARGPPWERSNARSSRETRGSNAESKKSCSKNVDASRCQPSLRNGQQPRQTSCQCLGLSCEKSPPPRGTIPMIAEFLATGGCCVVSPTQCPCWMMCDTTLAQGSSVGARHPIHVSCT